MRNQFPDLFLYVLGICFVMLSCENAKSQNLYNDTSGYTGFNFDFDGGQPGPASAGNEVVLAETAPEAIISQFAVQIDFTGTGTPMANVDVALYANNGPSFSGHASPGASPLWDSGTSALTGFGPGIAGNETLTYNVPNIIVPQDFTYVVTFSGLTTSEMAGLSIYGNTSGENYNDVWVNLGTGWVLEEAAAGEPAPQFGAYLTGIAVPEPSTPALGLMAACTFLASRLKSKFAEAVYVPSP